MHRVIYLAGLILLPPMFLVGCTTDTDRSVLRLDMSAEHDAGRFLPEVGDRVSIAGSFNGWERDTLFLKDPDGDWIYTLSLKEISRSPDQAAGDTVTFKFAQLAGDSRQIANQGWETLDDRSFHWNTLVETPPVLKFNEPFDEREQRAVTFTVGMRNQHILGFFEPEKGDQVVVSGDFIDWQQEGIPLQDKDADGIYSTRIPVKYTPGKPIHYRYRLIKKQQVFLPNEGWEPRPERTFLVSETEGDTPFAAFNDIRRVARFVVDTRQWERTGLFKPLKGDVLQVRLLIDGEDQLSDALFRVEEHLYETAIVIPLSVQDISYQFVRNMGETPLTEQEKLEVDLDGKIIRWPSSVES